MLNHIDIMGRLCRDPELRTTTNGKSVCSMSIACDRDFGSDGDGKPTDFVDVQCWGGTAEFAARYFTKGRMICVSGRLQQQRWQDKDGNNRVSYVIVADGLYFADSLQR